MANYFPAAPDDASTSVPGMDDPLVLTLSNLYLQINIQEGENAKLKKKSYYLHTEVLRDERAVQWVRENEDNLAKLENILFVEKERLGQCQKVEHSQEVGEEESQGLTEEYKQLGNLEPQPEEVQQVVVVVMEEETKEEEPNVEEPEKPQKRKENKAKKKCNCFSSLWN